MSAENETINENPSSLETERSAYSSEQTTTEGPTWNPSESTEMPVSCPNCGQETSFEIWTVLNAKDNPEKAASLAAGTLTDFTCPHCGFRTILDHPCMFIDPDHKLMVYNVCGDLVDEYNERLYAEDYSLDETDKTAQEFIDKIKGLDNADKDATCQHILIESALALDDIATAESSYKTLVDLEDKGVYPSNRLFDATTSENLRKSIDAAKEYLEAGPLPEGQG